MRQNLPDILSGDDKFSIWQAQILSYMSDDLSWILSDAIFCGVGSESAKFAKVPKMGR